MSGGLTTSDRLAVYEAKPRGLDVATYANRRELVEAQAGITFRLALYGLDGAAGGLDAGRAAIAWLREIADTLERDELPRYEAEPRHVDESADPALACLAVMPDVHLVRATLDEPAPPAPLAPGVDLRVSLLSALASRSILDAYGRASPAELDALHERLRANAPAVRRLTRRTLAAFLCWTEAALRPYLDDDGQAPAAGGVAR